MQPRHVGGWCCSKLPASQAGRLTVASVSPCVLVFSNCERWLSQTAWQLPVSIPLASLTFSFVRAGDRVGAEISEGEQSDEESTSGASAKVHTLPGREEWVTKYWK